MNKCCKPQGRVASVNEINRPGSCESSSVCVPDPCYSKTEFCNNTVTGDCQQVTIFQQFKTTVTIANSWNIPACGGSAILQIYGLVDVLVGSYIWNPDYGYFKVQSLNVTNGQLTIENVCVSGNAPAGTTVPANTQFIVATNPGDAADSWSPVLTASGSMSVSTFTIDQAYFVDAVTLVFFNVSARFTLAGLADINVYISTPTAAIADDVHVGNICKLADNSGEIASGGVWRAGTDKLFVGLPAAANFSLGAGGEVTIQGFYRKG